MDDGGEFDDTDGLTSHQRDSLASLQLFMSTEPGVCGLVLDYAALRFDGALRGHVIDIESRSIIAIHAGNLLVCPRAASWQDLSTWTLFADDGDPTRSAAQRQVTSRIGPCKSIYPHPGGAFLCTYTGISSMRFDGAWIADATVYDGTVLAADLLSDTQLVALRRLRSGALYLRLFWRTPYGSIEEDLVATQDTLPEASEDARACLSVDRTQGVVLAHVTDASAYAIHSCWGKWPRNTLKIVSLDNADSSWLALAMPRERRISSLAVGDADHLFVSDDLLGIAMFDRRDGALLCTLVDGLGERRCLLPTSCVLFSQDLDGVGHVHALRRHGSIVELFR